MSTDSRRFFPCQKYFLHRYDRFRCSSLQRTKTDVTRPLASAAENGASQLAPSQAPRSCSTLIRDPMNARTTQLAPRASPNDILVDNSISDFILSSIDPSHVDTASLIPFLVRHKLKTRRTKVLVSEFGISPALRPTRSRTKRP
jgi:hypothetical protein